MLMTEGRTLNKRVKQLTGTEVKKKTGKLRNSWRLKPVKLYKGGTVRVVLEKSEAPHAHLIEYGHQIYRGTGRSRQGKRTEQSRASASTGNKTRAFKILETAVNETRSQFNKSAGKMLDELTKELEL